MGMRSVIAHFNITIRKYAARKTRASALLCQENIYGRNELTYLLIAYILHTLRAIHYTQPASTYTVFYVSYRISNKLHVDMGAEFMLGIS